MPTSFLPVIKYIIIENLEEIINQKLQRQIQLIQNKNRYPFMDWIAFERIIGQELLPVITKTLSRLIEEQEVSLRKLIARSNQVAFRNDPERDKRIIEMFNQGLSKRKIAKEVEITPWGVSKALRRLGLN